MTRRNTGISRRELLARGIALGGVAMAGTSPKLFAQEAGSAGASQATGAGPFSDLRSDLRGELLTGADNGYDDARKLWNGTGVADVIDVVKYCRSHNLPVTVRGGGHNVAGRALRDGAVAIDLSRMKGVRVDPVAKTGRVQGGVLWRELDRETLAFDLVTTGGTVSTTGVGGLTLGGGVGWLVRKHGLACDNLRSVDVVTADGRFITASETENADLFWACRGGGGNFGVVTSFEFALHDLEPITAGLAMYPGALTRDVFHFFREFTSTAPDSVSAQAGVITGPPGTPVAGQKVGWIGVCHSGPAGEGERLLRPIKEFGPPAVDLIGPMSYTALQTMFDASAEPGTRNYWRSNYMTDLSDAAIDAVVARADEIPSPQTMLLFEHMQGAVARLGEQATAFSNRSAKYNFSVLSVWTDPADDDRNVTWTRAFGDAMKAFTTGAGYVNYMSDDESAQRVRATYQANYDRLVAVKRKYDPTNFFSGNQNIKP
jgi:FAD/FMN-containing dehydrogenase